jgi:hypothetical protein
MNLTPDSTHLHLSLVVRQVDYYALFEVAKFEDWMAEMQVLRHLQEDVQQLSVVLVL